MSKDQTELRFDLVLNEEQVIGKGVLRQVCGVYKMSDGSVMEFYADGDLLFYKINGQIWGALTYKGKDSFSGMNTEVRFVMAANGGAMVHYEFLRRRETRLDGKKILDSKRLQAYSQ